MAILINLNDARKKLYELEGSAEYNKGVTDAFNALFDLPTVNAEPQRAYEQGVKDTLDKYDETFRIASDIRCAVGCKTAKECRDLIRNGEIQRVKHGRWIVETDCEGKTRRCICDRCGFKTGRYTWENPKYCENCGAKMYLDEVENG